MGELAINVADGRMFLKRDNGAVIEVAMAANYYTRGEMDEKLESEAGDGRAKRFFFASGM
ncbi:MAG: hypothetical protein WEB57_08110 [Pseudohongiellaceae bacterium]